MQAQLDDFDDTLSVLTGRVDNVLMTLTLPQDQAGPVFDPATGAVQFGTGGVSGSSGTSSPAAGETTDPALTNVPESVLIAIDRAGGANGWNGADVRKLLEVYAPEAVAFFNLHFRLMWTSNGSQRLAVTTFGQGRREISLVRDEDKADSTIKFQVEIPETWSDLQVVQAIMGLLVQKGNIATLYQQWLVNERASQELHDWMSARYAIATKEAADIAQTYYTALAGLAPGGSAAVAVSELSSGNYKAAAFEVILMAPVSKLIGKGISFVTVKVGDTVLANVPVSVIQKFQKLNVTDQAELIVRMRSSQSADEAAEMVEDFLRTKGVADPIRLHHAWPKYLGGPVKQALEALPKSIHEAYHSGLDKVLPRQIRGGATKYYASLSDAEKLTTFETFKAYTKAFDSKYGTHLWDAAVREGAAP